MTEQTECRWSWCKPDKPGLWWWGSKRSEEPIVAVQLRAIRSIEDAEDKYEGWWAYIGPIPPEPLPPKKKVTQTLWMVPSAWQQVGTTVYFERWFPPDLQPPSGSYKTDQKREVEL